MVINILFILIMIFLIILFFCAAPNHKPHWSAKEDKERLKALQSKISESKKPKANLSDFDVPPLDVVSPEQMKKIVTELKTDVRKKIDEYNKKYKQCTICNPKREIDDWYIKYIEAKREVEKTRNN